MFDVDGWIKRDQIQPSNPSSSTNEKNNEKNNEKPEKPLKIFKEGRFLFPNPTMSMYYFKPPMSLLYTLVDNRDMVEFYEKIWIKNSRGINIIRDDPLFLFHFYVVCYHKECILEFKEKYPTRYVTVRKMCQILKRDDILKYF
jgi:hypothetical protein